MRQSTEGDVIYGHAVAAAKTLGWAGQGGAGRDMAPHRGGSEAAGRRAERAGSLQRGEGGSVPAPHRSPWRWPCSPRRCCCSPGHEEEKRKRFICVGS